MASFRGRRPGKSTSGRHLGRHFADPIAVRVARLGLVLLRAPEHGLTITQLLKKIATSRATLYRDLAALRQADWPMVVLRPSGDGRTRYRATMGRRTSRSG